MSLIRLDYIKLEKIYVINYIVVTNIYAVIKMSSVQH